VGYRKEMLDWDAQAIAAAFLKWHRKTGYAKTAVLCTG
jgi:hypothetical protein